jgi:hypothetical protein
MSQEKLSKLLQKGRSGNAVLFCGAGFTADCLNFDDPEILGVTSHLLEVLNEGLEKKGKRSGYKDVKNAAKRFKRDLGDYELMNLLKDRFQISHVSASVVDIVKFPWNSVYTTNYDNGIEIAYQKNCQKYRSVNNVDDPNVSDSGVPIIHLHGSADDWDIENFERSCILDNDSYRNLSTVKSWLKRLRHDIERAEVVVFVGFSANDLHLEQVFFNISELKEKSFFINRVTAEPDVDVHAAQEDFGCPLYLGRDAFASMVCEAIQRDLPEEPALASFKRFYPIAPSNELPSVDQIEDLLIWGRVDEEQIKRDIEINTSDYHVLRSEVSDIYKEISSHGKVVLVYGDICDGKSLVISGVMNFVSSVRPVFVLNHTYDDIAEEASCIMDYYPNAVFVMENCFSIGDNRLTKIVNLVCKGQGAILLSARSISTEAEIGKLKALRDMSVFREVEVGSVNNAEAERLIKLIDQIAGWRNIWALSHADRLRFVVSECQGNIPRVLLHLLNSQYVREKYKEEYNKTNYLDERDREMLIAALLISNLGLNAPLSFLSEIFESDLKLMLQDIERQTGGMRLLRVQGDRVETVPSIGARNLLRNIIEDREIVNTTIKVLERIAEDRNHEDFENHVFAQFMRYSILSSTVEDAREINRFFNHISKIDHFRRMPLFWLQWHMAMCEQESWLKAEKNLEMGYKAADAYEKVKEVKYSRKHLDDRKAKFLALRAMAQQKADAELFRDIKEAMDITGRLLRDPDLTYHSYETLLDIAKAFLDRRHALAQPQLLLFVDRLTTLCSYAKKRVDVVPAGYQRSHAKRAVENIVSILGQFPKL